MSLGRLVLRPTTPADVAALAPRELPYRMQAITGEVDGRPIGFGGLIYRPDGVWASILLTDEARTYKVGMHRAALMVLAMARRAGIRRLYATAEEGRAGAVEWLLRLGFRPGPGSVYVWTNDRCSTTAGPPQD